MEIAHLQRTSTHLPSINNDNDNFYALPGTRVCDSNEIRLDRGQSSCTLLSWLSTKSVSMCLHA